MKPLAALLTRPEVKRYTLDDYVEWVTQYGGISSYGAGQYPLGPQFTMGGDKAEPIGENFTGYVQGGLRNNGIVWTCAAVRLQVFSQARFIFQRLRSSRPGDFFGTSTLGLLEHPWPGGGTGDLLGQMILHADFAGNAYVARVEGELTVLRPDWTDIVLQERLINGRPAGYRKYGYAYWDEGRRDQKPVAFLPNEIAHFICQPDPLASYRGMSWITPIIREIQADGAATSHKLKFFENAATPNLAVNLAPEISAEAFDAFVERMEQEHKGTANAYKTLYTGGGADVTVIGSNLQQLDFKVTQGGGETRVAAASGVGAVIAQFSEGMQGSALTQGNYAASRRRFSDIPMRHAWQSVASSLETIIPTPTDARLWMDTAHIAFLQEDAKDDADIRYRNAQTIRNLLDAGYDPDAAATFAETGDVADLLGQHSGLFSVQLQKPESEKPAPLEAPTPEPSTNGATPAAV